MTVRSFTRRLGGGSTVFAGVLLLVLFGVAIVAPPLLGDAAIKIDVPSAGLTPSAEHWLGTNALGQDIGVRVLVATRLSLLLAFAATAISVVFGVLVGAAPTLLGKQVGRLVDGFISVTIAFPGLLLVLFLAVLFGVSTLGAVCAIGIAGVPYKARLVRNLIRSVESRDYVAAARIAGTSKIGILFRHILPNIAEPLIINTATTAGGAVLSFAGLSFLGIGVQAPMFDWGQLLHDGQSVLYSNPLAVLGPGVAVVVAGLSLNILGDSAARHLAFGGETVSAQKSRRKSSAPTVTVPQGEAALEVQDLHITYHGNGRATRAVRGINLVISRGEAVGVVGESGSGKSTMAMGIAQLLEFPTQVEASQIAIDGQPLIGRNQASPAFLASKLAVIFQDPMSSFNPVRRIGNQLTDSDRYHHGMRRPEALRRLVASFARVGINRPETRVTDYPHQFSGGMRQRAMIATALTQAPALIIADEPTTALDVTTEARVLEYLAQVQRDTGASLLLISHDLSVIRRAVDRVLVMYAGKVVEDLPAGELNGGSAHPYTRGLLEAIPTIHTDRTLPLTPIAGHVPDLSQPVMGCAFASRCRFATELCRTEDPALEVVAASHQVACWHPVARTEDGAAHQQMTRTAAEEPR